jgi:hypothetical protein
MEMELDMMSTSMNTIASWIVTIDGKIYYWMTYLLPLFVNGRCWYFNYQSGRIGLLPDRAQPGIPEEALTTYVRLKELAIPSYVHFRYTSPIYLLFLILCLANEWHYQT